MIDRKFNISSNRDILDYKNRKDSGNPKLYNKKILINLIIS